MSLDINFDIVEDFNLQYVSLPSIDPDRTSLQVFPCPGHPKSLVVWIHGGGWTSGDRRRTRNMPTFFRNNNILFASVNYPLEKSSQAALISLQVRALQGLNEWLTSNPLLEKYPEAFNNITILSHSAGSHLVALTDKRHGWNQSVSCLIMMDSAAYDLQVRFQRAPLQLKNHMVQLLGMDRCPPEEHGAILRSYSPALLPSKPRLEHPLKVIIITSQRPGACYSAEQLERSYQMVGYDASIIRFPWSHEVFPNAVGMDPHLNRLLLSAVAP
jgi:pimeloyl-ACP methyl ester carboxylesterase